MGYRGKVDEQNRARDLRAEGWTMPEIAETLGVSRSSVSLWTRDVEFTPRRPPRGGLVKRGPNKLQRRKQEEIECLLAEGRAAIGVLSERDFLIAGTALYAGEGDKRPGTVGMANTDPRMLATFCTWLRHFSPSTRRACGCASIYTRALISMLPTRSGPTSPAYRCHSSRSPTERWPIRRSADRSIQWAVRRSVTTARGRTEP